MWNTGCAYGGLVGVALEAERVADTRGWDLEAERVADTRGWDLEVIRLRTLVPLDFATVAESITRTGRCVVAHEAPRTLGMGAEIAADSRGSCSGTWRRPSAGHWLRHASPSTWPRPAAGS